MKETEVDCTMKLSRFSPMYILLLRWKSKIDWFLLLMVECQEILVEIQFIFILTISGTSIYKNYIILALSIITTTKKLLKSSSHFYHIHFRSEDIYGNTLLNRSAPSHGSDLLYLFGPLMYQRFFGRGFQSNRYSINMTKHIMTKKSKTHAFVLM